MVDLWDKPDIQVARFTSAEIARAAACPTQDLRNWLRRDILRTPLHPNKPRQPRLFSRENAYEISLVSVLRHTGIELPQVHSFIAQMWKHPESVAIWNPGQLDNGVARTDADTPIRALTSLPMESEQHELGRYAVTILNVPALLKDVDQVLDSILEEREWGG